MRSLIYFSDKTKERFRYVIPNWMNFRFEFLHVVWILWEAISNTRKTNTSKLILKKSRLLPVFFNPLLSVKWYMKYFICWTADLKSSKLWSSQLWTQFKQLRIEAWKIQDFNGSGLQVRTSSQDFKQSGLKPRWSPDFFRLLYAIA